MNETIERLKNTIFPVLSDGFVRLVDVMGDDYAVVQAARVTIDPGKATSDTRTLLRYMFRHKHGTPFEMCEVKLHIRIPMDAWRQMVRHRTASINEYSTRYSEAINAADKTTVWRLQSESNRQGSQPGELKWPEGYMDIGNPAEYLSQVEQRLHEEARSVYEERLRFGVAKEQARKDLPLSTYTEVIWKCDLRNLFHFLSLRMDSHAQLEIRSYANIIGEKIVAELFPLCWEAFQDYDLQSMHLSRMEVEVMRRISADYMIPVSMELFNVFVGDYLPNKREQAECLSKLVRMGVVS
jgi:thymidylate synthase (FAD)